VFSLLSLGVIYMPPFLGQLELVPGTWYFLQLLNDHLSSENPVFIGPPGSEQLNVNSHGNYVFQVGL